MFGIAGAKASNKTTPDAGDEGNAEASSSSPAKPAAKKKGKSYDYATKLNYLFREARFFLVKSNNAENVSLAKAPFFKVRSWPFPA